MSFFDSDFMYLPLKILLHIVFWAFNATYSIDSILSFFFFYMQTTSPHHKLLLSLLKTKDKDSSTAQYPTPIFINKILKNPKMIKN